MDIQVRREAPLTMRPLEPSELQAVSGGIALFTDITGMPDRVTGGCGTMWLLDRLIDLFSPTRR